MNACRSPTKSKWNFLRPLPDPHSEPQHVNLSRIFRDRWEPGENKWNDQLVVKTHSWTPTRGYSTLSTFLPLQLVNFHQLIGGYAWNRSKTTKCLSPNCWLNELPKKFMLSKGFERLKEVRFKMDHPPVEVIFQSFGALQKTPGNGWLEDYIPLETVPFFRGHVSFRGCVDFNILLMITSSVN